MPGLLPSPVTVNVKKDGATEVSVPLHFPSALPPGTSSGTITFGFNSQDRFAPSEFPVTFQVQGWVQSNMFAMGGGLVVLLVIAALVIILVWRIRRGKSPHFVVLVDGQQIQGAPIALRSGHELFLTDTASVFSLERQRNAKSIAKLSVKDGKVPLAILKQDRFPKVTEAPADTLGATIPFKAESGQSVTLRVQLADAAGTSARPQQSAPPAAPERRRAAPKAAAKKKPATRKAASKERKK